MPIKAENEWVYPAIGRTRAFRSDALPQHTVNVLGQCRAGARSQSARAFLRPLSAIGD